MEKYSIKPDGNIALKIVAIRVYPATLLINDTTVIKGISILIVLISLLRV